MVNCLAIQSDGKVIIGGNFTSISGNPRMRVARLNRDGTVDASFASAVGPNAAVHAVSIAPDGSIYIGGAFTEFDGVPAARLARLNYDGSLDTNFVFNSFFGADDTVHALAQEPGGRLYVGGAFGHFNGIQRNRVTRLLGEMVIMEPRFSENGFAMTIDTVTGRTYFLESATALDAAEWTAVDTVAGNGLPQLLKDPQPIAPRFYRVRSE